MLPPLVDLDAFEALVGEIADEDVARAQSILERVSARARHLAGDDARWTDEAGALTTVPDPVATVVLEVAERIWAVQVGVVVDSVGESSVTYDRGMAVGKFFTDADEKLLANYRPTQRPLASSLDASAGPIVAVSPTRWWTRSLARGESLSIGATWGGW